MGGGGGGGNVRLLPPPPHPQNHAIPTMGRISQENLAILDGEICNLGAEGKSKDKKHIIL